MGQHKPTSTSNVFGTLEWDAQENGQDEIGVLEGKNGDAAIGRGNPSSSNR